MTLHCCWRWTDDGGSFYYGLGTRWGFIGVVRHEVTT